MPAILWIVLLCIITTTKLILLIWCNLQHGCVATTNFLNAFCKICHDECKRRMMKNDGGHLSLCEGRLPQWGFPGSPRSPWQRCWRSTSWETQRGKEVETNHVIKQLYIAQVVYQIQLEAEKKELKWAEIKQ